MEQKPKATTGVRHKKLRRGKSHDTHDINAPCKVTMDRKILDEMFKYDPRGPNTLGAELIGSNVNPVLPLEVALDGATLAGTLFGPVTNATMRGWQATISNPSFPYYAFVYMLRALQNFAQGGDVITGTVPLWFALIIQSLVRKTVKMKAGKVNYQFTITSDASEFWVQGIGPSAYGAGYTFGRKSDPVVFINGDIPTLVPPAPYTDELGQQAIQSLWNFLSSQNHKHPAMHEMVSAVEPNKMTRDPSSFGINLKWPGGGQGEGGYFTRVQHEVVIKSPIFSTFVSQQPDVIPSNRYPNQIKNRSGDTISLGTNLIANLDLHQIHMKNPTSYKFIDMNEIVDVYLRWICAVQQNQVNTSFFDEKFKTDPDFFENVVRYPLTIQQLSILIRATLIAANQEHQIEGQGMFPRVPSSNNDVEFISLVLGQGLIPTTLTNQMLWPLMLRENILALRGREVKNGKGNSNPIRDVTVYGIYENTVFNEKDFTVSWTSEGESYTELCMASSEGEQTISLVDGQFGNLQYAMLSDPSFLLDYAAQHNAWIQSNSNTERVTAVLGSDNGIDALYSGGITRYWISQVQERSKPDKGEPEDAVMDTLSKAERKKYKQFLARKKKLELKVAESGPYAQRAVIAYTFGYEPFLEPWQAYQQFFVTPILKVDNTSNVVGDATGVYQSGAALGEPLNVVPALGDAVFPTLAVSHQSFAELMVKQPFADRASYDEAMVDLTKKGEAGILGALGANVLRSFGNPGVELAASLVEGFVPY